VDQDNAVTIYEIESRIRNHDMNDDNNKKYQRTLSNVLYEFMSEPAKLSELSKLVGKLRFASEEWEGFYDRAMIEEVESEILSLSMYLPDKYKIQAVMQSAKLWSDSGSVLTELYLERCYKLYEEDYIELQKIEAKIKWFESHHDQL